MRASRVAMPSGHLYRLLGKPEPVFAFNGITTAGFGRSGRVNRSSPSGCAPPRGTGGRRAALGKAAGTGARGGHCGRAADTWRRCGHWGGAAGTGGAAAGTGGARVTARLRALGPRRALGGARRTRRRGAAGTGGGRRGRGRAMAGWGRRAPACPPQAARAASGAPVPGRLGETGRGQPSGTAAGRGPRGHRNSGPRADPGAAGRERGGGGRVQTGQRPLSPPRAQGSAEKPLLLAVGPTTPSFSRAVDRRCRT